MEWVSIGKDRSDSMEEAKRTGAERGEMPLARTVVLLLVL
jgi:hypothetical protein